MIPTLKELDAPPKSIVLHWTGGGHYPNRVDKAAYHYLVDGRGEVHLGVPVNRNMRAIKAGDDYAAHIAGANSYRVGVAFCGMAGAQSGGPYGQYPLTWEQVTSGCDFVALLCDAWDLDPTDPRQLFTHAEAGKSIGVPQPGKWDILELPFHAPQPIGYWLRETVAATWRTMDEFTFPEPEIRLAEPKKIIVPQHIDALSKITQDAVQSEVSRTGRPRSEVFLSFVERVADVGRESTTTIERIVRIWRSIRD